jgi:hypothetical protein
MHATADPTDSPRSPGAAVGLPDSPGTAVSILRWPDDRERRLELELQGLPRLLVVGPDGEAPPPRDELEDWLRDPPDPAELVSRLSVLAERADRGRRQPRLDGDGLLWSGRRWVVIPDTQLCVVELFLTHPNELVKTTTITATYLRNGSSGHPSSVRTMLNRVVARFEAVGLELHVVRGKGALLDVPGL